MMIWFVTIKYLYKECTQAAADMDLVTIKKTTKPFTGSKSNLNTVASKTYKYTFKCYMTS